VEVFFLLFLTPAVDGDDSPTGSDEKSARLCLLRWISWPGFSLEVFTVMCAVELWSPASEPATP
jgi:hypothetical protein